MAATRRPVRHEDGQREPEDAGGPDEGQESGRLEQRPGLRQGERQDRDDGQDQEAVGDPLEQDRAQDPQPRHPERLAGQHGPGDVAQASRQQRVGEVADREVGERGPVAHRRERQQDPPPALRSQEELDRGEPDRDRQPERRDPPDGVGGPRDVDPDEREDDEEDADRDAREAPQMSQPRRRGRDGRHEGSGREHRCISV